MIAIGAATPSEMPAVLALLAACDLPLDGVREHFGSFLVARDGHTVVGVAGLELYADGALLRSVVVDPAVRATGLGRELTRASLQWAEESDAPAVFLLTTTAAGFFPRFGFVRISRGDVPAGVRESVEFRSACPASAVAMRKDLRADGGDSALRGDL